MNIAHFEEANPVSLLWQFPWLSQKALAKALGVNTRAVSNWVCGRANPSKTIRRLTWELMQIYNNWPLPFSPQIETTELNPLDLLKKFPGISRAALAEALGVSQEAIGSWVSGRNKPSPKVCRLAYELNKKWSALLESNNQATA